jgi:hypothetical protein
MSNLVAHDPIAKLSLSMSLHSKPCSRRGADAFAKKALPKTNAPPQTSAEDFAVLRTFRPRPILTLTELRRPFQFIRCNISAISAESCVIGQLAHCVG